MLDVQGLRDSFARAAMHGDAVPLFFYSDLFLRHPETRDLFPVSMAAQRDQLVHALAKIVSEVDNLDELGVYLQGLGRDHRKFGTVAEHYPAVGTSLLATLAHFNGAAWTPELAAGWKAAYEIVSQVMIRAARDDEASRPAVWEATVLAHELRRPRAGEAICFLAVDEQQDGGEAAHLVVAGDLHVFARVGVELGQQQLACVFAQHLVQHRGDGDAGAAPVGPDVEQDGLAAGGIQHLLLEVLLHHVKDVWIMFAHLPVAIVAPPKRAILRIRGRHFNLAGAAPC